MTISITAFERSPDGGKGLARDTRVRWALEEVGQPYEVHLVSFPDLKQAAHLARHPFCKEPAFEHEPAAQTEPHNPDLPLGTDPGQAAQEVSARGEVLHGANGIERILDV